MRAAFCDGGVVDGRDVAQLVVAPDERGRRHARRPLERHDTVCRHALGAAFQGEDTGGRQGDQLAHQAARRLADQHVAIVRLLLQVRRDVDRVADDLAGIDRDANTQVVRC